MLVLQTRCLESALDETSTMTLEILLSSVPIPINHTEKTVRKWSSVKEVGLQILQTEKIYNLCTRRWFLTASVQAYYNRRRRRRRRRRCSNRVAKLEWSSLILVLASRNVWHKRRTHSLFGFFCNFFLFSNTFFFFFFFFCHNILALKLWEIVVYTSCKAFQLEGFGD